MYPNMLIDDVATSIMPVGGRTEKRPFRAYLTPTDAPIEEMVAGAISRERHRETLGATLSDFVHDCAHLIMMYGEAYYEIVYLSTGEATSPDAFELTLIQPCTVRKRRGKLVQYIPPTVARERRLPALLELPEDAVLLFTPPRTMQRHLKETMNSLTILSREVLPRFALETRDDGTLMVPFDFAMYRRTHHIALATATRWVGWNARTLMRDDMLEYHLLERQLRFEKFKIGIRDQILTTLNEGLARAGQRLGFCTHLVVEGLPTLKEVEDARAALEAGKRSFKEILQPFLWY